MAKSSFSAAVPAAKPKFTPHTYQVEGIAHILNHPSCGLFYPPGLGKTATTLAAFKILKSEGVASKLLIIAPLRVCHNVWPQEVSAWSDFEGFSVGVLHGSDKGKILQEEYDIYVINPDGLAWLSRQKFKFDKSWMLICDESTLFKSGTSKRTKLVCKMSLDFGRKLILTGTPAPNGLINLWSQIKILDGGERLGKYITAFRNKYFYPSGYMGYEYKLQDGAQDRIYAAIEDIVLHKSQNELSLPPRLYNNIRVNLPTDAKDAYDQIESSLVAELQSGELVIAINAAVATNKLKQIANGGVNVDGERVAVHDAKTDVIESLVNELDGNPLLVIYEYKHDLERLLRRFPGTPYIGGGVTTKQAEKIIADWNSDKLPLLLLQPQAASHGLNLQHGSCQNVCWYSITFDLELYDQANARVHRQGVKDSVTIHHIVARDTIDEAIIKLLRNKSKVQNALLDHLLTKGK